MNSIKDPQDIISVGPKGFSIGVNPVEFRYVHEEDSHRLLECHVFVIATVFATENLVMSTAKTHPKDLHTAARTKGRMIAAGRMQKALKEGFFRNGITIFEEKDRLADERLQSIWLRLQKRRS